MPASGISKFKVYGLATEGSCEESLETPTGQRSKIYKFNSKRNSGNPFNIATDEEAGEDTQDYSQTPIADMNNKERSSMGLILNNQQQ